MVCSPQNRKIQQYFEEKSKKPNFAKLSEKKFRGDRGPLFVYIRLVMDQVDDIRKLAEENLSPDKFVVDILVSGKKLPRKVLVIIDGDQGVTIDDCAELSRILSKQFDERSLFGDENYLLEVSTPGLDHPLKLKRQYYKNTGRNLRVVGKETTTEGKLKEVTEDRIILLQEIGTGEKKETKEIEIPFSEIEKTFVTVSFK